MFFDDRAVALLPPAEASAARHSGGGSGRRGAGTATVACSCGSAERVRHSGRRAADSGSCHRRRGARAITTHRCASVRGMRCSASRSSRLRAHPDLDVAEVFRLGLPGAVALRAVARPGLRQVVTNDTDRRRWTGDSGAGGAGDRSRTRDISLTRRTLYQLSYTGEGAPMLVTGAGGPRTRTRVTRSRPGRRSAGAPARPTPGWPSARQAQRRRCGPARRRGSRSCAGGR